MQVRKLRIYSFRGVILVTHLLKVIHKSRSDRLVWRCFFPALWVCFVRQIWFFLEMNLYTISKRPADIIRQNSLCSWPLVKRLSTIPIKRARNEMTYFVIQFNSVKLVKGCVSRILGEDKVSRVKRIESFVLFERTTEKTLNKYKFPERIST